MKTEAKDITPWRNLKTNIGGLDKSGDFTAGEWVEKLKSLAAEGNLNMLLHYAGKLKDHGHHLRVAMAAKDIKRGEA